MELTGLFLMLISTCEVKNLVFFSSLSDEGSLVFSNDQ